MIADPEKSEDIEIIGDKGSHDALRGVLAGLEPASILDVPCGHGAMAKFLLDRGWKVHCADIDRGNLQLPDVPFSEVNLNCDLPFGDQSFEAVVCANGLHRLYSPGTAVREFSRILRPGGSLYITLNNYASLDRRIRFLLLGSINDQVNSQGCRQTISDPEAHVRIPLMYPQLAMSLEAAGFKVVDLQRSAVRLKHRLLWPFGWIVRLTALLVRSGLREHNRAKTTLSPAIMPGGGYFFLHAVKR